MRQLNRVLLAALAFAAPAIASAEPPDPCMQVSAQARARCASSPAARCAALAEQWRITERVHALSPNLSRARSSAESAARSCSSKSEADLAAGAIAYQRAIIACDGSSKDPAYLGPGRPQ